VGSKMGGRTRTKVTKIFKKNGLNLTKDSIRKLLAFLETEETWDEKEAKAEEVISKLKDRKLESDKITLDLLAPVLQNDGNETDDARSIEEPFKVIDSFSQRTYFQYLPVQKKFVHVPVKLLHGLASEKTAVFRERYETLLQRVLRNSNFRHATEGKTRMGVPVENSYEITTTQNLLGEEGKKCIFGILCEIEEGKIHLEDTHGFVEVDISDVELDRDTGFFTYNSFVLAEGQMVEGTFKADVLAFPPYERREEVLRIHPNLDFVSATRKERTLHAEVEQKEEQFIFISNVHLDDPRVISALKIMFEGYSQCDPPPGLFVFMGNFTKNRMGTNPRDIQKTRKLFDALCDIICRHSTLVELCRWVFIPGPHDTTMGNILPRRGLLDMITKKLKSKLNVFFPSNPCRIQYYTQEIVISREDLQSKLRRNTVLPCELKESDDLSKHLVKTVMDQAHISPLPLICQPLHWSYDHAMRLYPPPTCLVLGDSHSWYKYTYEDDCTMINPGEFNVDFSFVLYTPHNREFDYSAINM